MPNPPDYATGLGETIRAHRMYLGLSKDTMADKLGMNPRSYERIENNQRACPPGLLDTIDKIADAFDTAVAAIRDGDGPLILRHTLDDWDRAIYGRAAVETGRALHSEP